MRGDRSYIETLIYTPAITTILITHQVGKACGSRGGTRGSLISLIRWYSLLSLLYPRCSILSLSSLPRAHTLNRHLHLFSEATVQMAPTAMICKIFQGTLLLSIQISLRNSLYVFSFSFLNSLNFNNLFR